jgi:hypothetical protein
MQLHLIDLLQLRLLNVYKENELRLNLYQVINVYTAVEIRHADHVAPSLRTRCH